MSPSYLTVGLELSMCNQKTFTVEQLRGKAVGSNEEDEAVETKCDCLGPSYCADCRKDTFVRGLVEEIISEDLKTQSLGS